MDNAQHKFKIDRRWIVALLIVILFGLIIARLMDMQLRNGEEYVLSSQTTKNRTIPIKGMRGRITDVNGIPLAYDKESYNITFYRDSAKKLSNATYTQAFLSVMDIVEKNGASMIKGFALSRDEKGVWELNFNTNDPEIYGVRKALWVENMLGTSDSAKNMFVENMYAALVKRYGIPEDMPYEEAIKLLSIWQEVQMNAYFLTPTAIARDVSIQTVAAVEARSVDLPGIAIAEGTTRVYPRGAQAGNIVGYIGRMLDKTTLDEYRGRGYSSNDLIGITGIEKSMEDQLTGNVAFRQGSREVEVDVNRRVTRELSYAPPVNGNNVMLTIDLKQQQVLDSALERAILGCREAQLYQYENANEKKRKEYDDFLAAAKRPLRLAQTGAAVVMDVHTGKVLAMSTYKSYDPNLFIGGMPQAEYRALEEDPATPLFNKAISSRSTPGSVFKMVTALAGLKEGVVTPTEEIPDMGPYEKNILGGKTPSCWAYPSSGYQLHQVNNDVVHAIERSCNYYFYEVADRLKIDNLNKWASMLGLTSKTGIELPNESTSVVGNQAALYDLSRAPRAQRSGKAAIIYDAIMSDLRKVGAELGITYDEERLAYVTGLLMELSVKYQSGSDSLAAIRSILMEELGLSSDEIRRRYLTNTINGRINEIRWTPIQTVMTGIGQSITEITPIAMARYVAAVANGGTVYEAQIVDRILDPDGAVVQQKEPVVAMELSDVSAELELIRQGMHGVLNWEEGGTAGDQFRGFAYTDSIGGKTGTAQSGTVDIENNSWFVAFTPFDDPQIAIVVYIPNGYKGSLSAPVIKDVVSFYFESNLATYNDSVPLPNTIIP